MHKIYSLLFLLIPGICFSQNLSEEIDNIIENHHSTFPEVGLVVSVSRPGEIIYEKAKGLSDLSFEVPTQVDHKFRIGSVTKQFTAVAILQLSENHKLSLEDSIQKFLPEYPSKGKPILIKHLLSHTSGIPDYVNKPEWFPKISKLNLDPQQLMHYFKADSLNFSPGERFEYSNSGYHLLGLIIEKVSGFTYAEYLQKKIFQPLEMNSSFCYLADEPVKDLAKGYTDGTTGKSKAIYIFPAQAYSAGSIVSTVSDLRKWYEGLFTYRILKQESLEQAIKPFRLNDSAFTYYGFGWQLDTIQGMPVIKHGGDYPGYNSEVIYFPETKILVSAVSNSMPVTTMVKKIGALANNRPLPLPEFIDLPEKELQTFEAVYRSGTDTWIFESKGKKLFYTRNGSRRFEIKPVTRSKFYSQDWDVYLDFRDFKNSKYRQFFLIWNGQEIQFPLLEIPDNSERS